MSIYKVCEKCGDYPCHCGHEFESKSDGYILETIKNLQAIYNSRVKFDDGMNITVGKETLDVYIKKTHTNATSFTDTIPSGIQEHIPLDWTRHIHKFKNKRIKSMIEEIIHLRYTLDEFPFPSLYILFLLQHAGQLDDRKLVGFLLDYLIQNVKASTHATISVFKELKSSLSSGLPEFAQHAWTVYQTLKDVRECDPRDILLFELFYKQTQKWITEPIADPDRYVRFVGSTLIITTCSEMYYKSINEWNSSNRYWFLKNVSFSMKDELYYAEKQLTEYMLTRFNQEIMLTSNNLPIFES